MPTHVGDARPDRLPKPQYHDTPRGTSPFGLLGVVVSSLVFPRQFIERRLIATSAVTGILLVPWTPPLLGEKPIWEISYGGAYALAAVMLVGLLLTWWARICLGPLWSSVITRKEGHKIIEPCSPIGRTPVHSGGCLVVLAVLDAGLS